MTCLATGFVCLGLICREHTVFLVCDGDQCFLLLPDSGSVRRLALRRAQDEAELLVLLMDGVVRQADNTRLLGVTWGTTEDLNLLIKPPETSRSHYVEV